MSRRRRRLYLVGVVVVLVGGVGAWSLRPQSDVALQPAPAVSPSTKDHSTESAPAAWIPTQAEWEKARTLAAGLSLEELAGQLLVARHLGNESSLALVSDQHFAGVLVTSPEILDVTTSDPLGEIKAFNEQLHDAGRERGVPVLVPIDQEGGLVARLADPLTPFPTFMSAGAAIAGSPAATDVVSEAARASGAELRAAGYNAVFAPDGDVTLGAADPIIGSRSAGSDPAVVASAVVAAVEGYSDAGLISAVKHFPGHNVDVDSHKSLPVLASDAQRLNEHDLPPFKAAIAAAAPGIMTGHLDVPLLDAGVPASLSHKVVTDELRENLGFDGLIISDSLGMGAVMSAYPGGNAAVAAIKAGSDLALMPANNIQAYDAMLAALKSGYIPQKQARASATRVIAYLLHSEASPRLPGDPGSHTAASEALSAAAVTMVTRPCESAPLNSVNVAGSASAVTNFREAAVEEGLSLGSGPLVVLLGRDSRGGYGDIVVTTDTPYPLATSNAPTKIALYGNGVPAMRALAKVLMGTAAAGGALPVGVDGVASSPC